MYQIINNVTVWGEPLLDAVEQAARCARRAEAFALMADHHIGYAMPIGGVAAYGEHISPSGVGYDISCLVEGTLVTTVDGRRLPIEQVMGASDLLGNDGGVLTNVGPALALVPTAAETTLRLCLQNGDQLRLTTDHLLLTPTGWKEAAHLRVGDPVAVSSYVGVTSEDTQPVAIDFRLLRLLGFAMGDGHTSKDDNRISFFTSKDEDAVLLIKDLQDLGFENARIHRRTRPNGSIENNVYLNSKQLHGLFAGLGLAPGRSNWEYDSLKWLLDLPRHLQAAWLAGLFSAEMASPVVRRGKLLGGAVMKQGGLNPLPLLRIVGELLVHLGFQADIYPSGKPFKGKQTYQLLVSGGQQETVKLWRTIGFPYAKYKQRAAAQAMSVVWQRSALVQKRLYAVELCRELRQTGIGVYELAGAVSGQTGASFTHSMALKAIYTTRGKPRAPADLILEIQTDGDFIWSPVIGSEQIHEPVMVYDIPLGHKAHNFIAQGLVAHNCGNKAVLLDADVAGVRRDIDSIMDAVWHQISFGVGRKNAEQVDHPLFDDDPAWAIPEVKKLKGLAREQLGTVGSGNHYVDLFVDEQNRVWCGVHFGSRGFGHHLATHYIKAGGGKDGIHVDPVLLRLDSVLGQEYVAAMQLAGRYAYAGRDWVCQKVAQILGAHIVDAVHNHHNFAWSETHDGQQLWVVRKGATPAFPGQRCFVGGTMAEPAVILEGLDSEESRKALYSTVHGAGRVMSRTKAAGKRKWIKGRPVIVEEGAVSHKMMMNWVRQAGVELRGAGTDESPHCYKRLAEVLEYHKPTVQVLHTLTPIGVAMAGENELDPYKD